MPWKKLAKPSANERTADFGPCLSSGGRSLYFASRRPGGLGGSDIWVSKRSRTGDSWGHPKNLGPGINMPDDDQGPTLSRDERQLYFFSTRPGGFGGSDLYVARRRNKRDDFGWAAPENLGSGVNTAANDDGAAPFEVDETKASLLYFHSDRPGGLGGVDIYASSRSKGHDSFGPPVLVAELSSAFNDRVPAIRRDGLELFLDSDRPGTLGGIDLWVATRVRAADRWSTPLTWALVYRTTSIRPVKSTAITTASSTMATIPSFTTGYGDLRPSDDHFIATGIDFIAFSDDPTYRPGRPRRPNIDTVHFSGIGEWNRHPAYRFEVFANDQGEPGRHRESASIVITDSSGGGVASVNGDLDGGNVQSRRIRH
jgi:hypothetical protein